MIQFDYSCGVNCGLTVDSKMSSSGIVIYIL